MRYVIGSTVPLEVLTRDATGALVNATTSVLTITQPDASTLLPAITNPPAVTGTYQVFVVPTQVGRHNWYWDTTSPTTSTNGTFDVDATTPGRLVSVADFMTYLNNPSLDPTRASFILGLAQKLCESIVKPLPDGGEIVVFDVAQRAFANPSVAGGRNTGVYTEAQGVYNDVTPGYLGAGLWLTENNKQTLRQLAGQSGGAFSFDTLTATYTPPFLPIWDQGQQVTDDDFGFDS